MAGESPDKSKQLKSSGETTGTTGSERDPRLGVVREPAKSDAAGGREGGDRATAVFRTVRPKADEAETEAADDVTAEAEADADAPAGADAKAEPAGAKAGANGNGRTDGKGDARLKAAVAAWVASAEEDEPEDADGPSGAGAAEKKPAGDADAPTEGPAAAKPAADRQAATDGDEASGKAGTSAAADEEPAAADQPTAVFKTVRPKAGEGDEASDKTGGADKKPAADRPTAAPSAVRATGDSPSKADADADADGGDEPPAGDQPTAVFKAVRPKAAEGDEASDKAGGADKKPAVDRPTAVFKAVRPKAGEGDEASGKAGSPSKADADAEADADGGDEPPAGDQPTAVFKAVRPKADAAAEADAGDQPTELLKAPDPASVPKAGQARKSQFVPLKDDAPVKPAATKPSAGKPAAGQPAASAKPATSAKPAIPVSVTPPKAPAATDGAERTKQTPFPARPGAGAAADSGPGRPAAPLDLLAQLTNTPPPPETPVRTAMRRVKIWTPLVLLLLIIFMVVQAFRPLPDPTLSLGSKKEYTFAGGKPDFAWPEEGQSAAKVVGAGDVGTSGPQKPVPTASVAKVMTAYVVLKDHPLKKGDKTSNKITVDEAAEKESNAEGESTAKVRAGQEFSEYDMLRMLLIPSGNNIARLLARWDTNGAEDAFVKKMNDAAKELGMTNTTYTDPSGLTATTKSTAVDQVKLAEVMIKNPVVREITQQPNADIPGGPHINNNNDTLLVKGTGVLGIKTGSSSAAGGALMWAGRRVLDGKEYLVVGATMDIHFKGLDPNAENSLKKVKDKSYLQITAIQKAMQTATVVKKGDVVGRVDDGLGGRTPVVATKDVVAVGWPGFATKFTLSAGGRKIPHSAKAGTEIGELTVGSGADAVKVPVALKTALAEPSFGAKLGRLG
ncbi:D-alanyl-D-alanine carboxypeptidase [Streptomyces sp. SCA3-4]|uniref:D-alanyl-D-alanine carboxypeptidase family protein n=1 Tax=Streptomyces sichuanensis TaxID=2871810 RepID=UPI001CE25DC8|nr:D-alanyl-D-alanine carboxypeptidase [Streptomyces sichuanensis]MCA6093856.1 D-alanyl-D-alanine carboxypeptidase [Streptomyces sichuanensis]